MSETTQHTDQLDYKARILIVENDLRLRHDHIKNLTEWGYQIYVAEGDGRALLNDAIKQAMQYRCQVALVDMRLIDDDNPSDINGLKLVTEIKPTVSIIFSGYGDRVTVREALKRRDAYDFVGKEESPRSLKAAISKALRTVCVCRHSGTLHWHRATSDEPSEGVYQLEDPSNDLKTLADLYKEMDTKKIQDILEGVFVHLENWQLPKSVLATSLYDVYCSDIDMRNYKADITARHTWSVDWIDSLPDPISWVLAHREECVFPSARQALAHRNLHLDTIFINEHKEVWLKNFSELGFHHALNDFITIELDMLTCFSDASNHKLDLFYELAIAVIAPVQISKTIQSTVNIQNDPLSRKTITLIKKLRELALTHTHYIEQREYLWGILLEVVRRIRKSALSDIENMQMYILAGIICHRLEGINDLYWPPITWPIVNWFTSSMQREREVTVEYYRQQLELINTQISGYDYPPRGLIAERESIERALQKYGESV